MNEDIVQGAFEMHVHCSPDIVPRKTTDAELVRAAAEAGMGGLLIKSHTGSTVERACLLQQMVPEIRVFGGLALNHPVGGLNPNAVDVFIRMGAREVWMPTFSAQNMFDERHGRNPADKKETTDETWKGEFWPWDKKGLGITVLDEKGKLLPEVRQILEVMAASEAILGTGHLSIPETHAVLDAAREMKVKRLLITHPEYMAAMSVDDQVALAKRGVCFERCFIAVSNASGLFDLSLTLDLIVNSIRAVGVESNVLATDFGQTANPHPVDGMRDFLTQLLEARFSEDEIETMAVKTPSALLGI
jgi:hypothetical protein